MKTLYISYFGLREPLVQTQVLPYLRQLRRDGIGVRLLTFEPRRRQTWGADESESWKARLADEGIDWSSLAYHKRPSLPATVYDIAAGAAVATRLVRREGIDVIHGRSHVAAAMGALARRATGCRLIFDIRGFNAEEYVDAGRWPAGGLKYRLTKRAERAVLNVADGFVVLTERAREILFPGAVDCDARGRPIEVIPCCVDLDRFADAGRLPRDQIRRELNLEGRRVIVYLGALGGWYLTEEMAEFFAVAHRRDPATFAMILTQSDPEMIRAPLAAKGVDPTSVMVRKVAPPDVPRFLRAADIAISFIKPCYSKLSSSPTKMAEYLASGLPVTCSSGIGDVDAVVEEDRVGVLIRNFDRDSYEHSLEAMEALLRDDGLADRCRASARSRFHLEDVGGERYRRLYRRLFESNAPGRVPAMGVDG